ncbi:MAG: HD-GYP domain-containing protein [Planctomycetota bacterium]
MTQFELHLEARLERLGFYMRMRALGFVLFRCDEKGRVLPTTAAASDWYRDLFRMSPMFKRALIQAVDSWEKQENPGITVGLPGVWLTPLPVLARRQRRGYFVAVILTEEFVTSEHLPAMCDGAKLDVSLTRQLLRQLPPAAPCDVPRLTMMIRQMHDDLLRVAAEGEQVEVVGQQLGDTYEEISLLYTIIQNMREVERPDRFVSIACNELLGTLPYRWIGAYFAEDPEQLKRLAGEFIIAGDADRSREELARIAGELLRHAHTDEPIVLDTAAEGKHHAFAAMGDTALVHPLTRDGNVVGLLMAGDKQGADKAASSADMKLLGATASHMAIFLENSALYDDLNGMFLGTLEALTASIDAKDRYTSGHSQRVAMLTAQLAEAVGLDEQTVRRMHIAGLVHDVGKIGVPEYVLRKPGRLNEEEFNWIRKHPEIGHRILKDIPQLRDILPGVLHHHERWDGTGYPHGLAGESIPLVARLITLADAFDAMSSTRTYRRELSRHEVKEEIIRCAGEQFDPSLVPVFLKLDFSEFDRLIMMDQARRDSNGGAGGDTGRAGGDTLDRGEAA